MMLKPPELWPSVQTPPSEAEAIKDLYANLWGVAYNVEAWRSALELFGYCQGKPYGVSPAAARPWAFIAANECVHQLHHLRERLALIKGHKVRSCPSLLAAIDISLLRDATKKLDQYFPDIDPIRHAIAHAGANQVLPKRHAPPNGWLLTRLEKDGRYSTYYEGRRLTLEISSASMIRIEEVATKFFGAFRRAAQNLAIQGFADDT